MRKNKLYVILTVLTIIFLFSFAALCNQCGAPIEDKVGVGEEEDTDTDEDADADSDTGTDADADTDTDEDTDET